MPNFAIALKDEIRRLARKEIKAHTSKTQQAVVHYRREIASLKRQLQAQEKKIAVLSDQDRSRPEQPLAAETPPEGVRFSARSVRAQRKRLNLSAESYALLAGVSSLTIYNWEHGKARPQGPRLAALVALRKIGKREALARLELLKGKARRAAGRGSRR